MCSFVFVIYAVVGLIKLALEAGKATPAPPVGPALGSKGVNIMAFCKDYNARTADKGGYVIPVEITVYDVSSSNLLLVLIEIYDFWFHLSFSWLCYGVCLQDRSFTFILKTPPASVLLLKAAGMLFIFILTKCLMLLLWVTMLCFLLILFILSLSYIYKNWVLNSAWRVLLTSILWNFIFIFTLVHPVFIEILGKRKHVLVLYTLL